MRFAAELQLPSSTGVEARLVPRLIWHGLIRLISPDQPTGDPTFDGSLYTRTTTPEPTRGLFGKEGVQDALLAVMARCRDNEPGFNVVWVSGDRIGIRVSRLERLDEARHTELQLATAAFALHAIH